MTRRMTAHAMHACSPTISNHGGWTKLSSLSHTHTHTHSQCYGGGCVLKCEIRAARSQVLKTASKWFAMMMCGIQTASVTPAELGSTQKQPKSAIFCPKPTRTRRLSLKPRTHMQCFRPARSMDYALNEFPFEIWVHWCMLCIASSVFL